MTRRASTILRLLSATLAGAAAGFLLLPAAAGSATASRAPAPLSLGYGDYIYTYDFETETSLASNNVDWPMSILVYNGTSVNDVKAIMDAFNFKSGSTDRKHARLTDGATTNNTWEWDQDAGRKVLLCPSFGETTPHYRVYADSNDYLDSISRGPYVFLTTHRDKEECGGGATFYNAEEVEGGITNNFGTRFQIWHDRFPWYNAEPYRVNGNHVWGSDGMGSYVNRCPSCT